MSSQGPNADASLYLIEDNKASIVVTIVEVVESIIILLKARSVSYRMLRLAEQWPLTKQCYRKPTAGPKPTISCLQQIATLCGRYH